MDNEKVIYINTKKKDERIKKLKRKAKIIGYISYETTMKSLEDPSLYTVVETVGLYQGLKYNGSLKRGVKGGLGAAGAMIGVSIVRNIVINRDVIKRA